MKAEKFLIFTFALTIGVAIAGLGFYLYQSQKTIPKSQIQTISLKSPSPTPKPSVFITVDTPQNEDVSDSKTIKVAGKTSPDSTVIITTDADTQVISPAQNGDYSATLTIGDGENQLEVTAVTSQGQSTTLHRVITYSTETF